MSWLDEYVIYARNNEADDAFHWWCGVTILGAALKRNVYYDAGYFTVWPATWTLLVAESGRKKTTAVTIAYNVLTKMDEAVRVLADKNSPEGLMDDLAEPNELGETQSQALIYAPELSHFMDRRQHNEGLVQLLLRLADCPDRLRYKTRSRDVVTLKNVAVSFLGATANELLYDSVPDNALKSGFMARLICVTPQSDQKIVPFPWKDHALEMKVTNDLYTLSRHRGQMVMPEPSRRWFMDWYYRHKAEEGRLASEKMRAYYQRRPDHLLRTAMMISIAKHRRLEFMVDALDEALTRLMATEAHLLELYNEIDASPTGREQNKIIAHIRAAGGQLSHGDLMAQTYSTMDSSKLGKLVEGLYVAGVIYADKGKDGKPVYSLTADRKQRQGANV